jgi:chromosome segregation ATPase
LEDRDEFPEIFSKNLSELSVSGYKALCEGLGDERVGPSFEAVLVRTNKLDTVTSVSKSRSILQDFSKSIQLQTKVSFTTKIAQLQDTNSKLREEMEGWRAKTSAESERVKLAEEEICRWYKTNQQLEEQVDKLQDQANSYIATIEYLKSILSKCFQGLGTALPVLEEVKNGVSIVVS